MPTPSDYAQTACFVSGDIYATFIDAHVEKDTDGSRDEYAK